MTLRTGLVWPVMVLTSVLLPDSSILYSSIFSFFMVAQYCPLGDVVLLAWQLCINGSGEVISVKLPVSSTL